MKDTAIEMALAAEGSFTIKCPDGAADVFAAIVKRLLGITKSQSYEPFEQYKMRVLSQIHPDFGLADKIELLKANLTHYALSYAGARAALQEAYFLALPVLRPDINKVMNRLTKPHAGQTPAQKRLLRSIRAIPCNPISYEDNGDMVIQEAVIRLEVSKTNGADALRKHAISYENTAEWFSQLREIREGLLTALYPAPDPYINKEDTALLLDTLDELIQALQSAAEEKAKNPIIQEYLEQVTAEEVHRYLNPTVGTQPFIHKGTAVIDTDAYRGEIPMAERTIILSSRVSEADFTIEAEQKPPQSLIWLYKKARRRPVSAHILEMLYEGNKVGIWADDKEITREIPNHDVKNGTLPELYHDTFDVLYWVVSADTAEADIHIARSKANKILAIIGEPDDFPSGTALREIYEQCAGETENAKVYR